MLFPKMGQARLTDNRTKKALLAPVIRLKPHKLVAEDLPFIVPPPPLCVVSIMPELPLHRISPPSP